MENEDFHEKLNSLIQDHVYDHCFLDYGVVYKVAELCEKRAVDAVNTAYDNLGDAYTSKEMYHDAIGAIEKAF